VIGLQFGGLLSGAVITETIFSWPGIGRLAVDAIRSKDFPVVQGVVLVFAVTYALVNLFVDVLYAYLDPRLQDEVHLRWDARCPRDDGRRAAGARPWVRSCAAIRAPSSVRRCSRSSCWARCSPTR
jgi:hypothetical protein